MNQSMSLYQLSHEYLNALDALTDPEADFPLDVISDTLEGLEFPLQEKAVNVAKFFRNLESLAGEIKQAEKQMATRRKALENRVQAIKDYLKDNMENTGITRIESPWFRLTIQNNPAAVEITDADAIPEEYREIVETIKLDKNRIKDDLKNGANVPGARLAQSTRLAIR